MGGRARMEHGGWGMARKKDARAAVVGGGDDCARAGGIGSGEHGARNSFRRAKGDGANRRTRSAQERAKCAGGFGGGDHVVDEGNELLAEGLVQTIREGAAEFFVFA